MEIEGPFGRVKEIWFNDMGLGPFGPQFDTVRLSELVVAVENDDPGQAVEDEEEMN